MVDDLLGEVGDDSEPLLNLLIKLTNLIIGELIQGNRVEITILESFFAKLKKVKKIERKIENFQKKSKKNRFLHHPSNRD